MASSHADYEDTDERLIGGHSGCIFAILTLGAGLTVLGKQLVPVLLPSIIPTLDITSFQAGIALTAMELGYAFLQYPSGRFSDHLTRKTILLIAIGTVMAGYLILVGTFTYALFLIGVVFIGAGHGLFAPVSRALLSELFVERRGQAFGVYMMSTDIAGAVAASLAVVVIAVGTWNLAYVPLVIPLVGVVVLLQVYSRETVVFSYVPLNLRETGTRLLSSHRMRLLLVAYALYVFTIKGFVGFLPTYLHTVRGFSISLASTAFAALYVVGLAAKPIAGRMSDTLPRTLVGAGALSLALVGITIVITTSSVALVFGAILLYAIGHKGFGPVMQAYLMDIFPDESKGGDLGATRALYIGFGSLGPLYVGFMSEQMGFTVAFAGFIVSLLFAAGFTLVIDRSL